MVPLFGLRGEVAGVALTLDMTVWREVECQVGGPCGSGPRRSDVGMAGWCPGVFCVGVSVGFFRWLFRRLGAVRPVRLTGDLQNDGPIDHAVR